MATVRVARRAQKTSGKSLRCLGENGGYGPASHFAASVDHLRRMLTAHPLAYSERPELGRDTRGAVIGSYLVVSASSP